MRGKSRDHKNKLKCLKVLLFYVTHWEFALNEEKKIVLLTDSKQDKGVYEQFLEEGILGDPTTLNRIKEHINILTTDEYIASQADEHPEGKF